MNTLMSILSKGVYAGVALVLILYVMPRMIKLISIAIHKRRIYKWLLNNTDKWRFRSTQAIARSMYLTEDRVRYICSHHKKIALSTGEKVDMWSIRSKS